MVVISFGYIFILLISYIIVYFYNMKLKKNTIFISLVLFAVAFGIIAYHVDPPIQWDLFRHFLELERIRAGGINYLFSYNCIYHNQIGSALLYYLVSLQPDNHILPMLAIIIEYLILAYIVTDYIDTNQLSARYVFLALALQFSFGDLTWIISMVRQPLACAFCALAAYLDIYKRKRIGILCYIIGLSIHPGVIGVILIRLMFLLKIKKSVMATICIVWGVFSNVVASVLQASSITWIRFFGSMLYNYISDFSKTADFRFFIFKIIYILVVLFLVTKSERGYDNLNKYNLFFKTVALFTLGGVISQQIFMRYAMQLGYFCIPVSEYITQGSDALKLRISDVILFIFFFGSFAYQFVALTSHGVGII